MRLGAKHSQRPLAVSEQAAAAALWVPPPMHRPQPAAAAPSGGAVEGKTTVELNNVASNGWDCNPKGIGVVVSEEAQVEHEHCRSIILTAARKKKFSASRLHKLDGFSGERQRTVN